MEEKGENSELEDGVSDNVGDGASFFSSFHPTCLSCLFFNFSEVLVQDLGGL